MRIYITGASGFTGRHVIPHLVSLGYEPIPAQADLLDKAALASEINRSRPTHVLHLAAIAFVAHSDTQAVYQTNLLGTHNLLESLKQSTCLVKVLLASSANVYGNNDLSPLHETHMTAPANHYAVSKLAMEHMAKLYVPHLPIVIARPFNYTGPGQSTDFVIPKLVSAFQRKDARIELGNLDVFREFNDIRLICSAYSLLLKHGAVGSIVNVCTGRMAALREVLALLSSLTGHIPRIESNPSFVRANEVVRLCGSPLTLQKLALHNDYPLPDYSLRETLESMLPV